MYFWLRCCFFLSLLVLEGAASSRHILLLQSYNKGLVWSDDISKGVEEVFAPYKNYELTTEYMDTKKNEDAVYLKELYELFEAKLKNQTFEVVIAADDFAVNFALEHQHTLFEGTPLILCGVDKRGPGADIEEIKRRGISLVLESKEIQENIQFIQELFPNLEHLYIINDLTHTSLLINHIYEEEAQKLRQKGVRVTVNLEGSIEHILNDFRALSPQSVVLFGSLFRDKYGMYVPYYQVNDLINASPVPIFSISDSHLSKGVIGGYLLRGISQGTEAAKIALAYLQGDKVDTAPIVAPAEWIFDYQMLQKYNIPTHKLPKEALLINLPESFFDKHRRLVEFAFVLTPFILFFLFIALVNIYQRHKMAKRLLAKSHLEQVLLNNIQSLVFWIDKNGTIKGCNRSFCEFVAKPQEEILGRSICDIFTLLCRMPAKEQLFRLEEIEFERNERSYLLKSKTILDEEGKDGGLVTIINDMNEKKQLEINKQFIIQQSKLSEVGEMLSAIAHQWKVPLVELSAVAHKMQHYHLKDKLKAEDMKHFYDVIMTQTIYMGETIDGFRDFVRPSTTPKAFNIHTGIQEVLAILSSSMKYNNIAVVYKNHLHRGDMLFGYPNEFKQVILNIINNAKDAILEARAKGDKTCGAVHLNLYELDETIGLFVEDDGVGIDPATLPDVFKAFFSTKSKGDGFGLYMAKLIIQNKMHGKISLEPLQKGAQVCIQLPRAKEDFRENSST